LHPVARLQPTDRTGIDVFLAKHAQQLEEFKMRFYGSEFLPIPNEFFSQHIFQTDLPRLTYLDLGLFQWPTSAQADVTDGLVGYVGRVGRSLTRLAVRDCVLTFPQVVSLVSVVSSEASKLRSLEMHVYFLSCSLLDLLSQQLPMLYHLELRFDSLMSQDDGTWIANYYWNGYDVRYDVRSLASFCAKAILYIDFPLFYLSIKHRHSFGIWQIANILPGPFVVSRYGRYTIVLGDGTNLDNFWHPPFRQ
jgi:hypothetical protein